jgi:CheY-like chemotaxis protein
VRRLAGCAPDKSLASSNMGNCDVDQSAKKVLVAEDNPALAQVAAFNLERAGHDVVIARNGQEAWMILQEEPFDLVITDQQMPEMSGWELCEAIRASDDHCHTPVMFITAKGLELDRNRLQEELRVNCVFSKPYSPRELVNAVGEILNAELETTPT